MKISFYVECFLCHSTCALNLCFTSPIISDDRSHLKKLILLLIFLLNIYLSHTSFLLKVSFLFVASYQTVPLFLDGRNTWILYLSLLPLSTSSIAEKKLTFDTFNSLCHHHLCKNFLKLIKISDIKMYEKKQLISKLKN